MPEQHHASRRCRPLALLGALATLAAFIVGCDAAADDERVPDCEVTPAAATENEPAPGLDFAWNDIETVQAFDIEGVLADDQHATHRSASTR